MYEVHKETYSPLSPQFDGVQSVKHVLGVRVVSAWGVGGRDAVVKPTWRYLRHPLAGTAQANRSIKRATGYSQFAVLARATNQLVLAKGRYCSLLKHPSFKNGNRNPVAWLGKLFLGLTITCLSSVNPALSEQEIVAAKVEQAPVIDGRSEDPAWSQASAVSTHDPVEDIELSLKAVYTEDEIFFLVRYPDATESREHKHMVWDAGAGMYRTGPKREDTFSFKWSMQPYPVDLSISADKPYKADMWRFKAGRSDPLGYADDKMHIYSAHRITDSKRLLSKKGKIFYLARPGDRGRGTYATKIYSAHQGDEVPKYTYHPPDGSRADVISKASWQDGFWTIEFRRKLDTGHIDDLLFDTTLAYQFGVSRHEIAGKNRNPKAEQPNYGTGEIGETLTLVFQ